MKRVLMIGAGKDGTALLTQLNGISSVHIVAMIDEDLTAPGMVVAESYRIETGTDWRKCINQRIDLVIDATGDDQLLPNIVKEKNANTIVITASALTTMEELLCKETYAADEEMAQGIIKNHICNDIDEGLIIVDAQERVTFVNKHAQEIIGVDERELLSKPIRKVMTQTQLPQVLRSRKKEQNHKVIFENGTSVIMTTSPIINDSGMLRGAFAIFQEVAEIAKITEQVTGLIGIKYILQAIFQSSSEAISVVDEKGNGVLVNEAYTRLTGLSEKDVVGKPATVDISEGESIHMKVLRTRRPIRGVRLKVGPSNKNVVVNVSPIIVDGKLKGSIGILHDVSEIQTLTSELQRARQIIRNLEENYTFDDIIGSSSEMDLALEQAKVGAKTPATVLLRGEPGTGKELFAHAIHNESHRRDNKFIRINCSGVTDAELEKKLFGYENDKTSLHAGSSIGGFEEANKGSLFLDEIGGLSKQMQAKLLHVLKTNKVTRVGGSESIPIDVRIITSTNMNIEKAVMNGRFLEELYYRLNRLPIYIPPLRERMEDLEEILYFLIQNINNAYGRSVNSIDKEAFEYLKNYHWPGNIRELENVICRAMIDMDMDENAIQRKHIPTFFFEEKKKKKDGFTYKHWNNETLQQSLENYERYVIASALKAHQYNKTKTAEALDISIRSLYYKMEKYGIAKTNM